LELVGHADFSRLAIARSLEEEKILIFWKIYAFSSFRKDWGIACFSIFCFVWVVV